MKLDHNLKELEKLISNIQNSLPRHVPYHSDTARGYICKLIDELRHRQADRSNKAHNIRDDVIVIPIAELLGESEE